MERLSNEVEQFLQSLNNADHEGDADQNDTEEVVDVYFIPRQKIAPESDIVESTVDATPTQSTGGAIYSGHCGSPIFLHESPSLCYFVPGVFYASSTCCSRYHHPRCENGDV